MFSTIEVYGGMYGSKLTFKCNGRDKQRASEVAPECDKPMQQHPSQGQSTMQNRHGGVLIESVSQFVSCDTKSPKWETDHRYHESTRAEIRTGQNDQYKSIREDHGANCVNEAHSVLLIPRGSIHTERRRRRK